MVTFDGKELTKRDYKFVAIIAMMALGGVFYSTDITHGKLGVLGVSGIALFLLGVVTTIIDDSN